MKTIPLTRGFSTQVDDDVFEKFGHLKWRAFINQDNKVYAVRADSKAAKPRRTYYLHRLILNAAVGEIVDHADGNTLNNLRTNIRIATPAQNSTNTMRRPPRSGHRGVSWDSKGKRWRARFNFEKKTYWLGLFVDRKDAALAYDRASVQIAGMFARPNFVSTCKSPSGL